MKKDKSKIPNGHYCYEPILVTKTGKFKIQICPYWSIKKDKEKQCNGYCSFLGKGDWEFPHENGLLWDQVKECGINND